MEICYPFQSDTCYTQWQEIHSISTKWPWDKAVNTITLLKNNHITPNRNLSSFRQFFGMAKESYCLICKNLVENLSPPDNTHCAKLAKQGTPSICAGYMEGHLTDKQPDFQPKNKKD